MRVLMVGPKTFPPVIGGIETHVYEVSRRMAERGVDVTVLIPSLGFRGSNENVEGVKLVRVPALPGSFVLKTSTIPFIMNEIKKDRGRIVHAHDAPGGFAAALGSAEGRFVYTMHGLGFSSMDWQFPFRQGIHFMQTLAVKRTSHLFCTDERAVKAVKNLRSQAEVLSNGVDPSGFDKDGLKRPQEYEEGRFVLLTVGRLTNVKGTPTLLAAIRRIPGEVRKQLRIVVIGDGPLRGEAEALAAEFKEVTLLGTVNHADIAPYYAHADGFVLPSMSEGLPIALLEALAAGLPSVSSDVGGIRAQIGPEAVNLVPPGDDKALADAIIQLIKDEKRRNLMAKAGRERVSNDFSWDRVVDRLLKVYDTMR